MLTVLTSLIVIILAIYLLAIVTDEYFVDSLDEIAQKFELPNNVAGASLMAIGSSAPELAIALLALFTKGGANSNVGIGTIVGSAVFNILIITGVSAIVRPANITWRVVVRDVVMYLFSIGLLLATFSDGAITLFEALAYLGLYAVYILILFNWKGDGAGENLSDLLEDEIDEAHAREGLYHRITGTVSTVIGWFMGDAKKNYMRVFFVSILFIATISWFLVEYAVRLADALHVPPLIVALTVLAGGTSVPDLIASIVVAKQGRGEMAVSNAVGSNIFDILIGLGLPWLIAIGISGTAVSVNTGELWSSTLVLLVTVVVLFVFLTTNQQLSRREGWVLVGGYVAFVVWSWLGGG